MNKSLKFLLVLSGTLSLMVGIIGIFLPLLPTTPFLLITAACYYKGSDKLYNKLMNSSLGIYVINYREKRAIPLKIKIISIAFLWLSIGSSIFYLQDMLILEIFLACIAVIVTYHIARLKTLKKFEY